MKKYMQLLLGFLLSLGGAIQAAEPNKKFDPLEKVAALTESVNQKKAFAALPDADKLVAQMEIQQALRELKEPANQPKTILKEMYAEFKKDSREHFTEQIETVKWQNTLQYSVDTPLVLNKAQMKEVLGEEALESIENSIGRFPSQGIKIGLYNRDIAGLGLEAANVMSDVLLYRNLTRRKIEHIFALVKDDYLGFLRALELSLQAEEKHAEEQGEQLPDEYYIRTVACAPLRKYVEANHRLVGAIPFNKSILVPLVARYVWEKTSTALKDHYFPDVSQGLSHDSASFKKNRVIALSLAQKLAYTSVSKQDDNGDTKTEVKPYLGLPPLSLSRCAFSAWKFFYPSFTGLGGILKSASGYVSGLNDTVGLGIPEMFFSDTAALTYDIVGLGYSIKSYDDHMTAQWLDYVTDNRKELIIALRTYKNAVLKSATPISKINEVESELRSLIEEGHKSGLSWFPVSIVQNWRSFRQTGGSKISLLTGMWVSTVSAVKAAVLGKSLWDWWTAK